MYFKITNEKENHHGYQYVDDLNVLKEEFNDNPNDSCCAGGLYFTDIMNITKFLDHGVYLREITLPVDNPKFKMIRDKDGDKWRTNMIILGKRYDLCNIDTFKYLEKCGASSGGTDGCADSALANIHLASVSKYVATNGQLEILKWLYENGCELSYNIFNNTTSAGHLEILKWLYENKYLWDSDTCACAAINGRLEILKWLHEIGCCLSSKICDYAALYGHFEVLKWTRENGCGWSYHTCSWAAKYGYFEIFKWARENGCNWDKNECIYSAKSNNHVEIVEWIKNNS